MSKIPEDLKYTETHEWVRIETENTITVGITDHAQESLGDLVFVELPEKDAVVNTEDSCGTVESVKAASDIFSPIGGKIVEVNDSLSEAPELINEEPYKNGWLFKVKFSDSEALNKLLTAEKYKAFIEQNE